MEVRPSLCSTRRRRRCVEMFRELGSANRLLLDLRTLTYTCHSIDITCTLLHSLGPLGRADQESGTPTRVHLLQIEAPARAQAMQAFRAGWGQEAAWCGHLVLSESRSAGGRVKEGSGRRWGWRCIAISAATALLPGLLQAVSVSRISAEYSAPSSWVRPMIHQARTGMPPLYSCISDHCETSQPSFTIPSNEQVQAMIPR